MKEFLKRLGIGSVIGIAMIIPGVSGGTLAVLLNVYDKIIDSISNLRKDFKNSVKFLLPIILGALLGIALMYYPLKFALDYAPFPTVMLFVGLLLGSCPKFFKEVTKSGFTKYNVISVLLPLLVVIGICFIPESGAANLTATMPIYGYFLLILIGALASCALVIPGVSGSMLLLILGYYNEILNTVSALKVDFLHSFIVLACFGIGLIIGFFTIAKVMKLSLKKYPRGTQWAIIGFVVGSIPAIFITYNSNFPKFEYAVLTLPHILIGALLFILGGIATYFLTDYIEKIEKQNKENAQPVENITQPQLDMNEDKR